MAACCAAGALLPVPPPPPLPPPAQPAEGAAPHPPQRVWEATFCGRPCIIKQRFSKKYRHPALDKKLTVSRLKQVQRLRRSAAGEGALHSRPWLTAPAQRSLHSRLVRAKFARNGVLGPRRSLTC